MSDSDTLYPAIGLGFSSGAVRGASVSMMVTRKLVRQAAALPPIFGRARVYMPAALA